jgi:hypothetical protein
VSSSNRRLAVVVFGLVAAQAVHAVPVDSGGGSTINDRKNFIPYRKHVPLPGKIIGVLVNGAQPVLTLEGRSGPADQICLGYGGGSYRWLYVPVEKDAMIPWLNLPVGPTGAERKRFDNLTLAGSATLKPLGVQSKYALVEIEVNGGLGSPADDSCVATKLKVLDGSAEFPLKVEQVIAELTKRYQDYQTEQGRDINVMMEKAAAAAIKDKKSNGNRERSDVMFITWIPETERLRVHFRTTIHDGLYQEMGGEFGGPRRPMTWAAGRPMPPELLRPVGGRSGTQFGVEFGIAYEVSKSGKVERVLTLPMEIFQREIKAPPGMMAEGGGQRMMTMKKAVMATAAMRPLPPPPKPVENPKPQDK